MDIKIRWKIANVYALLSLGGFSIICVRFAGSISAYPF